MLELDDLAEDAPMHQVAPRRTVRETHQPGSAFRHAGATRIEIQLGYDARSFALRVRDDGKGIDPEFLADAGLPGHFGLRGMRERAERLGGKFTVWSAPASGTELVLSVPAATAYGTDASAGRSWLARKIIGAGEKPKS